MHESLTETLHLACTVVSVSHHCEIRVHAGIPATVSLNTVSCIIILDIVALAGRAYKSTGSTCKTWFVQLFPLRRIEFLFQFVSAPSFQGKIGIRKFFYDRTDVVLFFLQLVAVGICIFKQAFHCFCQCLTFFCDCFPDQVIAQHPYSNVCR